MLQSPNSNHPPLTETSCTFVFLSVLFLVCQNLIHVDMAVYFRYTSIVITRSPAPLQYETTCFLCSKIIILFIPQIRRKLQQDHKQAVDTSVLFICFMFMFYIKYHSFQQKVHLLELQQVELVKDSPLKHRVENFL